MESKAANIQMLYTDKRTTKQTLETVNGKIIYNMTNDYMFRAVLQTNKRVLAGIVGALLHADPESLDVEIQNPIILGQSFENKDFIPVLHPVTDFNF